MPENSSEKGYHLLLTGGSGFLGASLIRELLDLHAPLPVKSLRVFDLQPVPGMHDDRISWIRGDVRDLEGVTGACRGVDLVIHSAAVVDWGTKSEEEILSVNFQGTANVIEACRTCGVKALLYTSSLDVLFDGRPLVDVDEETPYPEKHSTSYCTSKFLAEKLVREANGQSLKSCCLRPSDIYGEGDPYHIGNLVSMARGGFYVRLGNGSARSQHVYVGNIAHAHVLAAGALLNGSEKVEGKAYFITDGPGTNFFTFFDTFVEGAGYRIRPRNLWLPRNLAFSLGAISEWIALLVRPVRRYRPKLSRFAVTYTCTDYTFNSERAREDFGFTPKYPAGEAFKRTVEHFRNHH